MSNLFNPRAIRYFPWCILVKNRLLPKCFSLRGMRPVYIRRANETGPDDGKSVYYNYKDRSYTLFENDRFIVKAAAIRHTVFCLGYVIQEKPVRGSFRVDYLVQKYGLKPGKLYRELQNGQSVTLADGRVINPEEAMEPSRPGRKIVVLGDTCDPSSLAHIAQDADILVHEATCTNEEQTIALTYMHSTAGMAGAFARRINAKRLILTHFSPRNFNTDDCIASLFIIFRCGVCPCETVGG